MRITSGTVEERIGHVESFWRQFRVTNAMRYLAGQGPRDIDIDGVDIPRLTQRIREIAGEPNLTPDYVKDALELWCETGYAVEKEQLWDPVTIQ